LIASDGFEDRPHRQHTRGSANSLVVDTTGDGVKNAVLVDTTADGLCGVRLHVIHPPTHTVVVRLLRAGIVSSSSARHLSDNSLAPLPPHPHSVHLF
jgi:hypothetical protein